MGGSRGVVTFTSATSTKYSAVATGRFEITFPTWRRRIAARWTPWGRADTRSRLELFMLGPGRDAPASYRAGLEAAFRRYGGRGPFPADPDDTSGAVGVTRDHD